MERQGVKRDRLGMVHHPEQHTPAVVFREAVALLDHLGHSGSLDHHIGTRRTHDFEDLLVDVAGVGVDRMGGAKFLRQVQFVIVKIDGNNGVRPSQMRAEDDAGADSSRTDQNEGFADPDFGVFVDDPESRRQGVRHQAAHLVIRIFGDFGEAVLRDDPQVVERGDVARVCHLPIPVVLGTGVCLYPVRRAPLKHHPVVRLDRLHGGPDFKHRSTRLVSQEMRQPPVGALDPVNFPNLGSANAAD